MRSPGSFLLLSLTALCLSSGSALAGPSTLITKGYDGSAANGSTNTGAISGDGRTVCFQSQASNLVAGDTNAAADTFIWTKKSNNKIISRSAAGAEANRDSTGGCALSYDGRFVAFATSADNLHPNLEPNNGGIIVVDMKTGVRTAKSLVTNPSLDGENYRVANVSDDGRYILFSAASLYEDNPEFEPDIFRWQWYLWDRKTDGIIIISKTPAGAPGNSEGAFSAGSGRITVDGRFVHFTSTASDLTNPSLPDNTSRAYVFDVKKKRVSLEPANYGYESPDGSKFFRVVWEKGIYVREKGKPKFTLLQKSTDEISGPLSLSRTGRFMTFIRNYSVAIFNTETKKYLTPPGGQAGWLSRDGKALLFSSTRLFNDSYIYDLTVKTLAVKADN